MVVGIVVIVIVSANAAGAGAGRGYAAVVGKRRGCREGGMGTVITVALRVALGQVARKVPHEGVESASPEELQGVLPLVGADETGVGDDLECCRFKRLVKLLEALLLAGSE